MQRCLYLRDERVDQCNVARASVADERGGRSSINLAALFSKLCREFMSSELFLSSLLSSLLFLFVVDKL